MAAAKNPQALVTNMMSQNPQMKAFIDSCGGDPQKAFYTASRNAGKDPDVLVQQIREMMK